MINSPENYSYEPFFQRSCWRFLPVEGEVFLPAVTEYLLGGCRRLIGGVFL